MDVGTGAVTTLADTLTDSKNYGFRGALSADGRRLAVYLSDAPATRIWDFVSGQPVSQVDGAALPIALSPDGSRLLTVNLKHDVAQIWATDSGRLIREIPLDFPTCNTPICVTGRFSPDTSQVLLWSTRTDTSRVEVWDIAQGVEVARAEPRKADHQRGV
jgi:WD40 repeat protein